MRVVLLAGGYGTRLEQGFRADATGRFAHLIGVPKPLVPVGDVPLLSHWIRLIDLLLAKRDAQQIDETVLVTNDLHCGKFTAWAAAEGCDAVGKPRVRVVSDGTSTNDTRLGAVADIKLAADAFDSVDDVVVIGGDTLFRDDFSLAETARYFRSLPLGSSLVLSYECEDPRKHGIIVVDGTSNPPNRVVDFIEKPTPEQTTSRLACPCFYILSSEAMQLLRRFLEEKRNAPLHERDATGNAIAYIQRHSPVYALGISGRFDVGDVKTYVDCCDYFTEKARLK